MSLFAVSLLVIAGCGVLIVAAALLRMYGAERRRGHRQVTPSAPADAEPIPRQS